MENKFALYKYYRNRMNRALNKIMNKLNRKIKS
jgi:hypothetical protein